MKQKSKKVITIEEQRFRKKLNKSSKAYNKLVSKRIKCIYCKKDIILYRIEWNKTPQGDKYGYKVIKNLKEKCPKCGRSD